MGRYVITYEGENLIQLTKDETCFLTGAKGMNFEQGRKQIIEIYEDLIRYWLNITEDEYNSGCRNDNQEQGQSVHQLELPLSGWDQTGT